MHSFNRVEVFVIRVGLYVKHFVIAVGISGVYIM